MQYKQGSAHGLIICLEGMDGAGKDTQIKVLGGYFRNKGLSCLELSYPNYSSMLGKVIAKALREVQFDPYSLQLLFSADRLRARMEIENFIKSGRLVIVSRYKWSAYVYAVARGLDKKWAKTIESPLPDPHLTIYLDITPSCSIQRTGGGDTLERDRLLLTRIRKNYLWLSQRIPNWLTVNAMKPIAIVHGEITNRIARVLERMNHPLARLIARS